MQWQEIRADWFAYVEQVRQRWPLLTDLDLLLVDGRRQVLARRIALRTGASRELVEQELAEFARSCLRVSPLAQAQSA